MKLLVFSSLPTFYFCVRFTWLFSLVYSCVKHHQDSKENGWIWLPCDTLFCRFFSPLDSLISIKCYRSWPGGAMGSIPGKGAAHTVANVITTNLYDENKLSIQPFLPVPSQLPVFEKSYKNHAKI